MEAAVGRFLFFWKDGNVFEEERLFHTGGAIDVLCAYTGLERKKKAESKEAFKLKYNARKTIVDLCFQHKKL